MNKILNSAVSDQLTEAAREVLEHQSGTSYATIVPTTPVESAKPLLEKADPVVAAAQDSDAAASCAAGLWLWQDFLDESHTISQNIDTAEGSFWHGIMHRREGDFSNSKYWYRRVGEHPIYATLSAEVQGITRDEPADKRIFALTRDGGQSWDPYAFVDLCESAHASPDDDALRKLAVSIQRIEWRLLFDHCVRQARG